MQTRALRCLQEGRSAKEQSCGIRSAVQERQVIRLLGQTRFAQPELRTQAFLILFAKWQHAQQHESAAQASTLHQALIAVAQRGGAALLESLVPQLDRPQEHHAHQAVPWLIAQLSNTQPEALTQGLKTLFSQQRRPHNPALPYLLRAAAYSTQPETLGLFLTQLRSPQWSPWRSSILEAVHIWLKRHRDRGHTIEHYAGEVLITLALLLRAQPQRAQAHYRYSGTLPQGTKLSIRMPRHAAELSPEHHAQVRSLLDWLQQDYDQPLRAALQNLDTTSPLPNETLRSTMTDLGATLREQRAYSYAGQRARSAYVHVDLPRSLHNLDTAALGQLTIFYGQRLLQQEQATDTPPLDHLFIDVYKHDNTEWGTRSYFAHSTSEYRLGRLSARKRRLHLERQARAIQDAPSLSHAPAASR